MEKPAPIILPALEESSRGFIEYLLTQKSPRRGSNYSRNTAVVYANAAMRVHRALLAAPDSTLDAVVSSLPYGAQGIASSAWPLYVDYLRMLRGELPSAAPFGAEQSNTTEALAIVRAAVDRVVQTAQAGALAPKKYPVPFCVIWCAYALRTDWRPYVTTPIKPEMLLQLMWSDYTLTRTQGDKPGTWEMKYVLWIGGQRPTAWTPPGETGQFIAKALGKWGGWIDGQDAPNRCLLFPDAPRSTRSIDPKLIKKWHAELRPDVNKIPEIDIP